MTSAASLIVRMNKVDAMKRQTKKRSKRRGSLTFEWIVLMTVVGLGVFGALGVVRNELVEEFGELVDTICATDVCN